LIKLTFQAATLSHQLWRSGVAVLLLKVQKLHVTGWKNSTFEDVMLDVYRVNQQEMLDWGCLSKLTASICCLNNIGQQNACVNIMYTEYHCTIKGLWSQRIFKRQGFFSV
ncbi:hypothetical protein STEG23_037313, partial [Scotinomys teguina]